MKYVIFKTKHGLLMPVIVPEHVTHSQIQIEDAKPDSAGFVNVHPGKGLIVENQISTSLKLGPKIERDTRILECVIANMTISFYLEMR